MDILYVFCGGATGAVARFSLSQWIGARSNASFPIATLFINSLGCFFIGFLLANPYIHTPGLLLLDVGFTGAFTTFSTFSYETWRLIEQGEYLAALLNPLASIGLGLALVVIGTSLGTLA